MTQNFFDTFNLPVLFNIDIDMLNHQYRTLQKTIHPDRFVNATDAEKKQSLQKSTQINDAYQVLKDPIKRASHIISLHQVLKENTLPPDFLMQQMEWEEEFETINDLEQVQLFSDKIDGEQKMLMDLLAMDLDEKKDWESATNIIGKLKFITNLFLRIQQRKLSMDNS
ncbi:Fe-S protein assembly co-chaperone HscB [Methylophilaceae bacterium]|nr:Fe-S protein assembly co-chaperone HscB [Methylophilaceae bacterium]